MDITHGKYIRIQKSDPDEGKLLDYLKNSGNSQQMVVVDDVGDDAMISLTDSNYTPTMEEVLYQDANI